MARITVEDCVTRIPNRFELVMIASQRARQLGAGQHLTVDKDNDKNPVVALREIAEGNVAIDGLREALVRGHQRIAPPEDQDEDVVDLMEGEQQWAGVTQADAREAATPLGADLTAVEALEQGIADEVDLTADGGELPGDGEEDGLGVDDLAAVEDGDPGDMPQPDFGGGFADEVEDER